MKSCTADACRQGRCPCPDACHLADVETFPWTPVQVVWATVIVLAVAVLAVVIPGGPA